MIKLLHRGDTNLFLENTIESIKSSITNKNYNGLEIDVKLTKDNKWIIFHDISLYRLTKINKKIKNIKYENLPLINYKNKLYKIPLLKELQNINFNDKILDIEIKNNFNINNKNKNNLFKIINKINTKIIISSFNWNWNKWCIKHNLNFAFLIDKKIPKLNNKEIFIFDINLLKNENIIKKINKIDNIKIGCYTLNKNNILNFNCMIEIWDN